MQEQQKTILLVEDEALIAIMEKEILKRHGFDVILAPSGEKAIEIVQTTPDIDLILMDINLGKGMDGTEAAEMILKERDIPVLFLSSYTQAEVVEKTEKITSFGYVVKDSGEMVLIASIRMAFKLHEAYIELKKKEKTIRESEEKYRTVADYTYDWEYWVGPDGNLLYISPSCERITGYCPEEFRNDPSLIISIVHPEDRPLMSEHMCSLEDEHPHSLDFRILTCTGEIKWISHRCQAVFDYKGTWVGHRGSNRDITDRKEAEDISRKSEELFSKIFHINPFPMALSTLEEGRFRDVNEAFCEKLGYKRDDIIGKTSMELHIFSNPSERTKIRQILTDTGRARNIETQIRRADGSIINGLFSAEPFIFDEEACWITAMFDITDRRQAEETLRENEEIFNQFMEHSPIYVFFKNEEIRAIRLSKNFETLLGRPTHECIGKTMDEIFPSDLAKGMIEDDLKVLREGKPVAIDEELKGRFYRTTKFPVIREGKPPLLAGFTIDITEQKKLEKNLSRVNERFALATEAAHMGVWDWDIEKNKLVWDERMYELYGLKKENFSGAYEAWVQGLHPDDRARSDEISKEALRGKREYDTEFRVTCPGGTVRILKAHGTVIRDKAGNPQRMIGVNYDITEGKQTEELLNKLSYDLKERVKELNCLYGVSSIVEKHSNDLPFIAQGIADLLPPAFQYPEHAFSRITIDGNEYRTGNFMETPWKQSCTIHIHGKAAGFVEVGYGRELSESDETQSPFLIYEIKLIETIAERIGKTIERIAAEEKLTDSEQKYHNIFDDTILGIYQTTPDGCILNANPALVKMYGYDTSEELINNVTAAQMYVNPEERNIFKRVLSEKGKIEQYEVQFRKQSGEIFWVSINAHVVKDEQENITHYDGTVEDITGRKVAENQIKSLLAEKELLLKEVHHRIKNNMNTINGLLTLQAVTMKDPEARTALEESGRRVRSMMALYDKLYQSKSFNTLSVMQYLPSLVDEIVANFPNSKSVKIEKKIDDFMLDAKRLQPLGIIINELLTNIMKYAFTGKDNGFIKVSAKLTGNRVSLVIEDNGAGMPESINFENSTGFGLMLVGLLAKQLEGTIRIERGNGTRIILEFEV